MLHAREDYNSRIQDSAGKIPADEPVFLLRAQDRFAATVIVAWLTLNRALPDHDKEALDSVEKHLELFRQWPKKHTPDV